MVGSYEDAKRALAKELDVLSYIGSTRTVYRAGNVVYKVENHQHPGTNKEEYCAMFFGRDTLPHNVRYPEVTLYNVEGTDVIAMEYIEGTAKADCFCYVNDDKHNGSCLTNEESGLIRQYLDDTGGFNVILSDGVYYIIDAA